MSDTPDIMTLQSRLDEAERQLQAAKARILELNRELDAEIAKKITPADAGAELARLRTQLDQQGNALRWASGEAKGRLPEWFHATASYGGPDWLNPSEAAALRDQLASAEAKIAASERVTTFVGMKMRAESADARVRELESACEAQQQLRWQVEEAAANAEARLRDVTEERDAFREQLVGCLTVLGKAIERLPLNESAEIGIQRLSRDCAALLDRYPLSAACSADLPPHPDTIQLRSLLARIHRDGGHYTEEHGIAESCAEADRKIVELLHAHPDTERLDWLEKNWLHWPVAIVNAETIRAAIDAARAQAAQEGGGTWLSSAKTAE